METEKETEETKETEDIIINDTKIKYENGEIYSFIKLGNCHTKKWFLLKGSFQNTGYCSVKINKKTYLYHRVVYKLHNPDWDITDYSKTNIIDHIDRNKLNNHISNLRVVTQLQNSYNTNAKGYFYDTNRDSFRTQIAYECGKVKFLGRFKTEEEAHKAYLAAKKIYHIII